MEKQANCWNTEVALSCHECHSRIKQFSCRLYLYITNFKNHRGRVFILHIMGKSVNNERAVAQQILRCCHHQPIEPAKPVYHFSRKSYGIFLCLPVLKRIASSAASLKASGPFSKSISRGRSPSGQSFI